MAGFSGEAVTNETPAVNNEPTGLPTISGTAEVGEVLTASVDGIEDADGLTGATFKYQWLSNDGTTDTDIEGETEATYKVADTDVGKTLKVRVTFTDDGETDETLVSDVTAAVAAAIPAEAPPDVEGSPTVSLKCWDVTNVRDAADSYPGVTFGLSVGGERTLNTEGGGVVGGVPYSVYWHVEFSEPVHKLDGEMSEITSQDGTAIVTPVYGGPTSGRPNLATVINPPAWLVAEYEAEEHYSEGYRYNAAVLSQWGADPVAS